MIVAHLADLHLGFRAYHRVASDGSNARERDVADAFAAAIDAVIAARADLVLLAGDVFHSVRPPNSAIFDAFSQLVCLRAALPDAPVVVIAGNHDSPRSADTGSILRVLTHVPGVRVVERAAETVRLEGLDVAIRCVPHPALLGGGQEYEPDPAARLNLLVLHGTVTGAGTDERLLRFAEFGGARVDAAEIDPDRWDYVALGHYHIATPLAPNMWYAGATERTSTNPWIEDGDKGFLLWDTEARTAEFRAVPSRPLHDLPAIEARVGGEFIDAERLDELIRERVASLPGLDDRIVRLVVHDVPRDVVRRIDHAYVREMKARALHFHLDLRRPARGGGGPSAPGERRQRGIEEEVRDFVGEWSPGAPGIDGDRLVELALHYLGAPSPCD